MLEREDLLDQVRHANSVSGAELAQYFKEGSIVFRLLGNLVREQDQVTFGLIGMDLVTEEGRMAAIKQQGIAQGRMAVIEGLVDMILEGVNENEHGNSESGSDKGGADSGN